MTATKILLYAGILLVGGFSVLHYFLYLRLRDVGINKTLLGYFLVAVPVEYLRNRGKYGWPAWPVVLMCGLVLVGFLVFVVGLFRLSSS